MDILWGIAKLFGLLAGMVGGVIAMAFTAGRILDRSYPVNNVTLPYNNNYLAPGKVDRDSAGRRTPPVGVGFLYQPPKAPSAQFFGRLEGVEINVETPPEKEYLNIDGFHL